MIMLGRWIATAPALAALVASVTAALAALVMRFRFLRLQVAGLAAIDAVVQPVIAQADVMQALAQSAVAVALALVFREVANPA